MTEGNERVVVLIGNPKVYHLLNVRLDKAGYIAPILKADEARPHLVKKGEDVDALFFQIDQPETAGLEETLSLIVEFTPICPNATILVYGNATSKEKFAGLERVLFVENPTVLLPSRLLAKVEEILVNK